MESNRLTEEHKPAKRTALVYIPAPIEHAPSAIELAEHYGFKYHHQIFSCPLQ